MSEELIELLSETFLWECTANKTEDINELSILLEDIYYLDDKEEILAQITECKVIDTDFFDIIDIKHENTHIFIEFNMPFTICASINENQIWRISGSVNGSCIIPDTTAFDWNAYDWDAMSKDELLSLKHIIEYRDTEYKVDCDTY